MKSVKAQLSIFVIIGAILLLSLILIFSLSDNTLPFFSDQKDSFEVREFVESCLDLETKNALRDIGLSGGHYYHPDMVLAQSLEPSPVDKQARGFVDPSGLEQVYWYYYDDSAEEFKLNVPDFGTDAEYSIKNQVKRYVNENIDSCLDDFNSFEDQFTVEYEEDFTVDVEFDGEEVITTLNHDFRVLPVNSEGVESFDRSRVTNYNSLRVPYYLARDIVAVEEDSSFVEKRILQFLGPYQDSDSRDLLPPFYDFKTEYDMKPWNLEQVRTLIKNIISSHIHRIQFLNTNYQTFESADSSSEFASNVARLYTNDYLSETSLVLEEDEDIFEEFEDYSVLPTFEVFYPSFISITPSYGNTVMFPKAEALFEIVPIFFTEYNAVYEMSQGVVFEIENEKDELVFRLPVESNIDYNKPLKETPSANDVDVESQGGFDSLICDPNQFISDYVTLNISDPINNGKRTSTADPKVGVDGALVTFSCKGLATCYLGETSINGEYEFENTSNLKLRLPTNCNPGTLEVSKYGHKSLTFENLDPQVGNSIDLGEVEMPSLKEMHLNVRLCEPGILCGEGSTLRDNERAIVIFNHLEDESLTKIASFDGEDQYNVSVELTLGNYSIEAFVFNEEGLDIPEDEVCYKKNLIDEECQTIDAIKIETWLRGSYTKEYEVTKSDVLGSDTVTVKVLDFGLPRTHEQLGEIESSVEEVESLSSNPVFTREE